jgi:hypothetical protein
VARLRAKALEILERARQQSKRQEIPPLRIAQLYAGLGEKQRALDWLEKAYDERDPMMAFLNVSPSLDSLHSERRFQDLVRRMNFPVAERY